MDKIVLFCKTFKKDFNRLAVQFSSIQEFNRDNFTYYICIPKEDKIDLINHIGTKGYEILYEEDYLYMEKNKYRTSKHLHQQLYKLLSYSIVNSNYYFILDSDMYFIKDFGLNDFIQDGIPYIVMHEAKPVLEYTYLIFHDNRMNEWFEGERRKIMSIFGRKGKLYDYSGTALLYWSSVIKELIENYLPSKGMDLIDAINYCGSENTWYGEYLLWSGRKFLPCEPHFKTFHYKYNYALFKKLGITEEYISKNYLGITMQSSWGAPLKY